jgi:exosortase
MSPGRRALLFELALLAAILLQFGGAFAWVARTWTEATYESWGLLALLLAAAGLRRLPCRRPIPSTPHLVGLAAVAALDLAAAPLGLNVVSAALGVVSLHLWLVAFRAYRGRWLMQPQLWLGLLCLPVVYWANVLFGFHLQQLVSRLAAGCLQLYGLSVRAEGTLLHLPVGVVAVDSTCSGLKLLYSGVLFGILVTAHRPVAWPARLLFWGCLLLLLLGANVLRVTSLVRGQLQLGRPVGELAHQGIGLVAFGLVCAAALWLWRRLDKKRRQGFGLADGSACTWPAPDPGQAGRKPRLESSCQPGLASDTPAGTRNAAAAEPCPPQLRRVPCEP